MMTGKEHILFTENDNETFLAVKTALLPHLHKPFDISQLVFQVGNQAIGYNPVDDHTTVSSLASHRVIELQLLTKEREWTQHEKLIIRITSERRDVSIHPHLIDTPGKMAATIHGLENNDTIKSLEIKGMNIMNTPIMDVLRDKMTNIEELKIFNNGMNADEMAELFDSLSGGRLHTLIIGVSNVYPINFRKDTYRMNDLVELLSRNTSLLRVNIYETDVEIAGDLSNLAYVLFQQTLVSLQSNRIISNVDRQALIDSIEPVRLTSVLNFRDNNENENEMMTFVYNGGKQWIPRIGATSFPFGRWE